MTLVRILPIAVGLVFSGCIATNQRTSDFAVGNLQTIAVVAVEAPPIFVHPSSEADRLALVTAGVKTPPSAAEPWSVRLNFPVAPGFFLGAAIDIASYAQSSRPRSGAALLMTSDKPSQWMPTVNLAIRATQQINASGHRKAFVVEGYAKLPDVDRTKDVPLGEWLAVVRRWFNSDEAMLDPAAITPASDAILQVGVLSYEYYDERLLLQVMVKMIDKNGRVIGKAREHSDTTADSVAVMMRDGGTPMRDLVDASGASLLARCLHDLGLASR